MKFYLKELVGQALFLPNGAKVPFEDAGGTYGLLQTADPYLIGELDKAVKTHTGGVIPLTEAEYNSWVEKKKALASSLGSLQQPRDREILGPIPFQQLQAIRAAGAAAVVASPVIPGQNLISSPNQAQQQAGQQRVEPLSIPTGFSKPRVGKIPKAPSPPAPSAPSPTP